MVEEIKSKFSIIPTFLDTEIPVSDYTFLDGRLYFIDDENHIGQMKEEHVGIIIINEPTEEDFKVFSDAKISFLESSKKTKKTDTNYC